MVALKKACHSRKLGGSAVAKAGVRDSCGTWDASFILVCLCSSEPGSERLSCASWCLSLGTWQRARCVLTFIFRRSSSDHMSPCLLAKSLVGAGCSAQRCPASVPRISSRCRRSWHRFWQLLQAHKRQAQLPFFLQLEFVFLHFVYGNTFSGGSLGWPELENPPALASLVLGPQLQLHCAF